MKTSFKDYCLAFLYVAIALFIIYFLIFSFMHRNDNKIEEKYDDLSDEYFVLEEKYYKLEGKYEQLEYDYENLKDSPWQCEDDFIIVGCYFEKDPDVSFDEAHNSFNHIYDVLAPNY